jgi:predicted DNA-binding transcriptional regulator YafY
MKRMKYHRYAENTVKGFIAFEDHTLAMGTEWLDELAEIIHWKKVLAVHYTSFSRPPELFLFHPYFLKEYRNRWFVLGRHQLQNSLFTLALDRIKKIQVTDDLYLDNDLFDPDTYFKDMIGVTRIDGQEPETIKLIIYKESVPHVETKKIHHSQRITRRNDDGSIEVELCLLVNYELISTILGFGAAVRVVEPGYLVRAVKEELMASAARYSR